MNSQHEIIEKIIRARKERAITQQKLADLISVPQSTIARIEAEIVSPRLETLLQIANALDLTVDLKHNFKK